LNPAPAPRVQNRIVARYLDGRTLKGQTADFLPTRTYFHVIPSPQAGTSIQVVEVKIADLKAVFFVRDLVGDAAYNEAKAFTAEVRATGRKVQVKFADGEDIVGTTMGYEPDRLGFFVVPVDPKSNNERCFVVMAAVKAVTFL
jgi:hypothetical protein